VGTRTGNATWQDSPSTATLITAAKLNAIENVLDASLAVATPVSVSGTPTAGQVITATSGTAASWQTPSGGGGGVDLFPKKSGAWIGQSSITTHGQSSNGVLPSGTLQCELLICTGSTAIDRMGCNVGTAGAASSVIRLGIYAISSTGDPGSLVLDAGTVTADSTGDKTATVSTTLPAGAYWMVAVSNDASGTLRVRATSGTQSTINHLVSPFGAAGPTTSNEHATAATYTGYTAGSALPSTATTAGRTLQCTSGSAFPEMPMIYVRKA
jgi:hypothetical protein